MEIKLKAHEILVEEHITIRKMINNLISFEKNIEKNSLDLLDIIIDFFHVYADQCHHIKEEKYVFERVRNKLIKSEEKSLLEELIKEHIYGRKLVNRLNELKLKKDLKEIRKTINEMVNLYEKHIEKENVKFFPIAFKYFSEDEKKQILEDFILVDKTVFHEKYMKIAEDLENSIKK